MTAGRRRAAAMSAIRSMSAGGRTGWCSQTSINIGRFGKWHPAQHVCHPASTAEWLPWPPSRSNDLVTHEMNVVAADGWLHRDAWCSQPFTLDVRDDLLDFGGI
jgi:hypothetical protein